ncbi:hypothetical protein TruAng_010202 [Truncatella angustata]|nr:hypothetical protein TruAng_010202 [Truncatella angustata]
MFLFAFIIPFAAIVTAMSMISDGGNHHTIRCDNDWDWTFVLWNNVCNVSNVIHSIKGSGSYDCAVADEENYFAWGVDHNSRIKPGYSVTFFSDNNCSESGIGVLNSTTMETCHSVGQKIQSYRVTQDLRVDLPNVSSYSLPVASLSATASSNTYTKTSTLIIDVTSSSTSTSRSTATTSSVASTSSTINWSLLLYNDSCSSPPIRLYDNGAYGQCEGLDGDHYKYWGVNKEHPISPGYMIELFGDRDCMEVGTSIINNKTEGSCINSSDGHVIKGYLVYKKPFPETTSAKFPSLSIESTASAWKTPSVKSTATTSSTITASSTTTVATSKTPANSNASTRIVTPSLLEPAGSTSITAAASTSAHTVTFFSTKAINDIGIIGPDTTMTRTKTGTTTTRTVAVSLGATGPSVVGRDSPNWEWRFGIFQDYKCTQGGLLISGTGFGSCQNIGHYPEVRQNWAIDPSSPVRSGYTIDLFRNADCTGYHVDVINSTSENGCHSTRRLIGSYRVSKNHSVAPTAVSESLVATTQAVTTVRGASHND